MIRKVVIVDDDELNNFVCQMVIKTAEFAKETQCFLNPIKALEFLKHEIQSNPDKFPEVIFIDINMPGMSGWEFLKEFNSFPAGIKNNCSVFMLSSSIDEEDITKAKENKDIKEYLSKPLAVSDLMEIKTRFKLI